MADRLAVTFRLVEVRPVSDQLGAQCPHGRHLVRVGRGGHDQDAADVEEQADIVMVKPALAYLDVIRAVREQTELPLAAYNVSGEYAMVKAAAAQGWLDERAIVLETLTAIRRAGADILITYHAKDAARWLR